MGTTQFKAGDRVEVIDAGCNGVKNGDRGVVEEVLITGAYAGSPIVNVSLSGQKDTIGLFAHRLKLILEWKVGDRVIVGDNRIEKPWKLAKDAVGAVCELSNEGRVCVTFPGWDGGHSGNTWDRSSSRWFFHPEHLLPAPDVAAPVPATSKESGVCDRFKVGDVLIMKERSGLVAVGERVEVVRCDGDGFPMVLRSNGYRNCICDFRAELAPPEKPQAFIVISDEGAGRNPVKYSTRDVAEEVASQAALVRPGVGFTVYQAVTAVKAPKPEASVTFLDKAA